MAPHLNGDVAFTPSVHHEKVIPIAVVGIGWRGPGDALNVEEFYKMLAEAREARAENHNSKWKHDAFYHPDSVRKGTASHHSSQ
jgi:acyl transferase domain-containing protein